jgi:hypothetical protein
MQVPGSGESRQFESRQSNRAGLATVSRRQSHSILSLWVWPACRPRARALDQKRRIQSASVVSRRSVQVRVHVQSFEAILEFTATSITTIKESRRLTRCFWFHSLNNEVTAS